MKMDKLFEIKNLKTFFHTEAGTVKAVNDVSFDIYKVHHKVNYLGLDRNIQSRNGFISDYNLWLGS